MNLLANCRGATTNPPCFVSSQEVQDGLAMRFISLIATIAVLSAEVQSVSGMSSSCAGRLPLLTPGALHSFSCIFTWTQEKRGAFMKNFPMIQW